MVVFTLTEESSLLGGGWLHTPQPTATNLGVVVMSNDKVKTSVKQLLDEQGWKCTTQVIFSDIQLDFKLLISCMFMNNEYTCLNIICL